jgi:hypothetical protein
VRTSADLTEYGQCTVDVIGAAAGEGAGGEFTDTGLPEPMFESAAPSGQPVMKEFRNWTMSGGALTPSALISLSASATCIITPWQSAEVPAQLSKVHACV